MIIKFTIHLLVNIFFDGIIKKYIWVLFISKSHMYDDIMLCSQ